MSEHPLFVPPAEVTGILARLRRAGYEALLCGGCVRDALLGRRPKDYDIATAADPETVERLFPKTLPIGRAFGVMLVEGADGGRYEVATFRSDLGYRDGRRPEAVRFSSAREDALRRDFTMNALFYDPAADRVIDYVGGREDLAAGILRTVGDPRERFREDHLRLLRAVRFAARTGFRIEGGTARAAAGMAELVTTVSPERVAAEVEAMLTDGHSREAFRLLKELGLLRWTLPEVDALSGVAQPPEFHPEGDAWLHTLLVLEHNDRALRGEVAADGCRDLADIDAGRGMSRGDFSGDDYVAGVRECRAVMSPAQSLALAWGGLLHDIGKPGTLTVSDRIRFNDHDRLGAELAKGVLERLRRPRRTAEWTYDLIRRHMHFATLRRMRKSKLRRWLGEPNFPLHLELHRLDCAASHGMLANWWFGLESWREERARPPVPEPLLRGTDLIGLGIPAGPEIGRLLRLVEDARLEGGVASREEALALARREAASPG